jgi:hypothetical protein
VTALAGLLPPGLELVLAPEEEAVVRDALEEPVALAARPPMVQKALAVAAAAHRGQVRKGSGRPYILHPVAVAQLLVEAGCGNEVVAAGLLHDTLEDTSLTLGELRGWFGGKVASIVAGCSEPHKSVPWEQRKGHTLKILKTAPWEVAWSPVRTSWTTCSPWPWTSRSRATPFGVGSPGDATTRPGTTAPS